MDVDELVNIDIYRKGNNYMELTLDFGKHWTCIIYSYETIIAIEWDRECYIAQNVWGPTTGKHIGYAKEKFGYRLNERNSNIPQAKFKEIVDKIFGNIRLFNIPLEDKEINNL